MDLNEARDDVVLGCSGISWTTLLTNSIKALKAICIITTVTLLLLLNNNNNINNNNN